MTTPGEPETKTLVSQGSNVLALGLAAANNYKTVEK